MIEYYSPGKLLLTGEYLVLDGATALALPTKFGQSLKINTAKENGIFWKSFDKDGKEWLTANFRYANGEILLPENEKSVVEHGANREPLKRLREILIAAHDLNPEILENQSGMEIETHMDFDRNWGLGSSSTLINNIAQWFRIDAYQLLEKTFGGSGYDIGVAQNKTPITYTLTPNGRSIFSAGFDPDFKENLFFVYLNQKQNSRNSIAQYKKTGKTAIDTNEKITSITQQIISCTSIEEFELLLHIHETIISQILGTPKIKSEIFPDYSRAIKSLGGWGGDFVLATGGPEEREYFRSKGYNIIFEYSDMIL